MPEEAVVSAAASLLSELSVETAVSVLTSAEAAVFLVVLLRVAFLGAAFSAVSVEAVVSAAASLLSELSAETAVSVLTSAGAVFLVVLLRVVFLGAALSAESVEAVAVSAAASLFSELSAETTASAFASSAAAVFLVVLLRVVFLGAALSSLLADSSVVTASETVVLWVLLSESVSVSFLFSSNEAASAVGEISSEISALLTGDHLCIILLTEDSKFAEGSVSSESLDSAESSTISSDLTGSGILSGITSISFCSESSSLLRESLFFCLSIMKSLSLVSNSSPMRKVDLM